MHPKSGFWMAANHFHKSKKDNGVTICWHDVIVKIFWRCCVSLVKFSYLSKFHVNIITVPGVITTIFVYKGLTGNREIRNTPVWVLPNIWRLGSIRDTTFSTNLQILHIYNIFLLELLNLDAIWLLKLQLKSLIKCLVGICHIFSYDQKKKSLAGKLSHTFLL